MHQHVDRSQLAGHGFNDPFDVGRLRQIAEDAQLITGHMIMQWMAQRLREQDVSPAAAARG